MAGRSEASSPSSAVPIEVTGASAIPAPSAGARRPSALPPAVLAFEVDVATELAGARPPAGHRTTRWHGAPMSSRPGIELFGGVPVEEDGSPDLQFVAARRALTRPVTVIAGGPGTGKTHTVARILAAALLELAGRGATSSGSRWPHRPEKPPHG